MSTTRTPAKRAQLPRPRCPRLAPADAANQPTQKMTQPTPITMSTTRIEVPLRVRIAGSAHVLPLTVIVVPASCPAYHAAPARPRSGRAKPSQQRT